MFYQNIVERKYLENVSYECTINGETNIFQKQKTSISEKVG